MRTDLVERLLDQELTICDMEQLAGRGAQLWRNGTEILLAFDSGRDGNPGLFVLDCAAFDAQPPAVSMADPHTRDPLPLERWTPGVPHSIHPTFGRPFICIQGVLEYHTHPSHLDDSWDRYRRTFRISQIVRRLLDKAGVAP
jgi:hypothetical protein